MKFGIKRSSVMEFDIHKCQNAEEVLKLMDLPKSYHVGVEMGEPECVSGKPFVDSKGQNYFNPKIYIEINTLEELLGLIKEVGKLVVDKDEIIIYDYYLE